VDSGKSEFSLFSLLIHSNRNDRVSRINFLGFRAVSENSQLVDTLVGIGCHGTLVQEHTAGGGDLLCSACQAQKHLINDSLLVQLPPLDETSLEIIKFWSSGGPTRWYSLWMQFLVIWCGNLSFRVLTISWVSLGGVQCKMPACKILF
jgi:hypothetical protein